ncbi:YppF family protein [Peribacillus kribbensis]|uniref:YppF family protein n=1 Tax=Peribacillus kribbensis TaxID=356658 RepID=UPI0012DF9872|nr:YppF family protein [Peribacillus kribbensis]
MKIQELIVQFMINKSQPPKHANFLLDYARNEYVSGKICLQDYRQLLLELSRRGATHP